MPVIESPVKRFPGSVTLPDFPTYIQVLTFGKAYHQARARGDEISMGEYIYITLPGMLPMIETWSIAGIPEHPSITDIEQMKPGRAVAELLAWLWSECVKVYAREEELPNESGPKL